MTRPHILYGLPHSLYTGPARAYLRKSGVAFVERSAREPEFRQQVMPAIGRSIIPVLVTPEGQIVQDSVDIIDHVEAAGAALSAYPDSPRHLFLAHLFQLFGSQGLLRAAMHYRWSYYDVQGAFLDHAFGVSGAEDDPSRGAMRKMQSYLPGLGVRPDTIPLIEQGYHDLLAALEAHLSVQPYLLGGRPSLGDYAQPLSRGFGRGRGAALPALHGPEDGSCARRAGRGRPGLGRRPAGPLRPGVSRASPAGPGGPPQSHRSLGLALNSRS